MRESRLGAIVIDCENADMESAARLWSQAFGYQASRYPDATDAHYAHLASPLGEVKILLQSVTHPSRVHLDIETDDIEAQARRFQGLGARSRCVGPVGY